MSEAIRPPFSAGNYPTREADCLEAIKARFRELHDPSEDYIDLIKEAMDSGWSMREARLAINKLLGADLKNHDNH